MTDELEAEGPSIGGKAFDPEGPHRKRCLRPQLAGRNVSTGRFRRIGAKASDPEGRHRKRCLGTWVGYSGVSIGHFRRIGGKASDPEGRHRKRCLGAWVAISKRVDRSFQTDRRQSLRS